jgi:hypothetical protein
MPSVTSGAEDEEIEWKSVRGCPRSRSGHVGRLTGSTDVSLRRSWRSILISR